MYVPHARVQGAPPRRVEVERVKRQYAAAHASLESLLKAEGVDFARVSGGDAAGESSSDAAAAALLPLEAFDDGDFEVREPPEAWVELGLEEDGEEGVGAESEAATAENTTQLPQPRTRTRHQRGVPAQALDLGSYGDCGLGRWRACRVYACSSASGGGGSVLYSVAWTAPPPSGGVGAHLAGSSSVSRPRAALSAHLAAASALDQQTTSGDPHPAAEADEAGSAAATAIATAAHAAASSAYGIGTPVPASGSGSPGGAAPAPPSLGEHLGTAAKPRLFICFAAEDPARFARRVGAAFAARRRAVALLHHAVSISCMPPDPDNALPAAAAARIAALLNAPGRRGLATKSASGSDLLASLLADASIDFCRTMSRILFDAMQRGNGNATGVAVPPPLFISGGIPAADRALLSSLVPPPPAATSSTSTARTQMRGPPHDMPPHDYAANAASFAFHFLYTRPEAVSAVVALLAENGRLDRPGAGPPLPPAAAAAAEAAAAAAGVSPAALNAVLTLTQIPGPPPPPPALGGASASAAAAALAASPAPPLLLTHAPKSLRLDEFEHAQAGAAAAYGAMLRDAWGASVRAHFRACFGSTGKGHFNLRETDAKAYEYSKLRRFLVQANFRMQDELRYCALAGLEEYVGYMEAASSGRVTIASSAEVSVEYPAPIRIWAARRPAVFSLDLAVKDAATVAAAQATAVAAATAGDPAVVAATAGAKGAGVGAAAAEAAPALADAAGAATGDASKRVFAYSVPVPALEAAALSAFDRAVRAAAGVLRVERTLMDKLFWPSDPTIGTLHPAEPAVMALRARLAAALAAAAAPVEAYLRTLSKHAGFLNTDADALLAELKGRWMAKAAPTAAAEGGAAPPAKGGDGAGASEGASEEKKAPEGGAGGDAGSGGGFNLAEAKGLIAKHRAAAVAVLDEFPPNVGLGLATLSTTEVRTALARKHRDVADGVVRMVAAYASEAANEISRAFDGMVKALSVPPGDIESLVTLKEYISGCPERMREQSGKLGALAGVYEALEVAGYPLPRDQFDAYWRAEGGVARVAKKITEVESNLEREQARYMEEMATEQVRAAPGGSRGVVVGVTEGPRRHFSPSMHVQAEFEESLNTLAEDVSSLQRFTRLDSVGAAAPLVAKLKATLDDAERKSRLFNTREGLFGRDLTSYERLGDIKKTFEPFSVLWETTAHWMKAHSEGALRGSPEHRAAPTSTPALPRCSRVARRPVHVALARRDREGRDHGLAQHGPQRQGL